MMKKVFKVIGLILLLIIAFVLIAGLFISRDFHFERSVTINAPKEVVWENIRLLENMDKWSPWKEHDPNMQQSFEGVDGLPGAKQSWKGNKEVGSGSQEIIKVDPLKRLETKLRFLEPFESEADAYFNLKDEAGGVNVTWGFDSKFPYPMNVSRLFMNMDDAMDKEFNKGLGKLKTICEGR